MAHDKIPEIDMNTIWPNDVKRNIDGSYFSAEGEEKVIQISETDSETITVLTNRGRIFYWNLVSKKWAILKGPLEQEEEEEKA